MMIMKINNDNDESIFSVAIYQNVLCMNRPAFKTRCMNWSKTLGTFIVKVPQCL